MPMMPERCREPAADEINVTSDGGLTNPTQPDYQVGGSGVWWPERCCETNPVTPQEVACARNEVVPRGKANSKHESDDPRMNWETHGVGLFISYAGLYGSSTRQEIIGATIAIMSRGPVHIGIDSYACLKRMWEFLSGGYMETLPRVPWNLLKDGDLWEIFHTAAHVKGVHAIKATKLKAHATNQDVDDGVITPWHRVINKKADDYATEGIKSAGFRMMDIAALFALRQRWYVGFIGRGLRCDNPP